jgi:hypothetical protein
VPGDHALRSTAEVGAAVREWLARLVAPPHPRPKRAPAGQTRNG